MPRVDINLGEFSSDGIGVLAGRGLGEAARARYQLDALDRQADSELQIEIPDFIYSINSSFFLGMFAESIRSLGEAEFRRRFKFVGDDADRIVDDGIRKALRTASPLPPVEN